MSIYRLTALLGSRFPLPSRERVRVRRCLLSSLSPVSSPIEGEEGKGLS
jgi:hypothetical protein